MTIWLARARRMTAADAATGLEVLMLAAWIEVALQVMPFARLLRRVNAMRPGRSSATELDCLRLSRLVAVAYGLLPFPGTCLRRSLVLHALLIRRGVASRFCLGVARSGASLDAHAWVECDGLALDGANARFGELLAVSQFARTSPAARV